MTAEQRFYQQFRKALPVGAHCVRIETSTESGMPDTNICFDGMERWVELKVYVSGRVLIRKEQRAWGFRRYVSKGECYILAQHPSGVMHLWKFPNITAIVHGKYLWVTNAPILATTDWRVLMGHLF